MWNYESFDSLEVNTDKRRSSLQVPFWRPQRITKNDLVVLTKTLWNFLKTLTEWEISNIILISNKNLPYRIILFRNLCYCFNSIHKTNKLVLKTISALNETNIFSIYWNTDQIKISWKRDVRLFNIKLKRVIYNIRAKIEGESF